MARQSRATYITGARDLDALATIASGENPDGTAFSIPMEQGTAGATPWLVTPYQAGSALSTSNPLPTLEASRTVAAANYATATNAAATLTYAAAGSGVSHVIGGIVFSYSGTPTGGSLTITDGGVTVFSVDITASGPGPIVFPRPMKFAANSAVVVTLAAGGSGIVGKVQTSSKWTE